jgi:hypothetical protein
MYRPSDSEHDVALTVIPREGAFLMQDVGGALHPVTLVDGILHKLLYMFVWVWKSALFHLKRDPSPFHISGLRQLGLVLLLMSACTAAQNNEHQYQLSSTYA